MKEWTEIPFDLVANRLERCCIRNNSGEVSWNGAWLDDCQFVLTAYTEFKKDIVMSERRSIVWQAINDSAKKGTISSASLKASLKNKIGNFRRRKLKDYTYVTKLSVNWLESKISLRYGGATITISGNLPKKFDRSNLDFHRRHGTVAEDPPKYSWVRVSLKARAINEAHSIASDALDFFRGTINYGMNANIWSAHSSDESKPINKILLGPCHTLHNRNGKQAGNIFWYEPHYRECSPVSVQSEDWEKAFKFFITIRKRVKKSNYGPGLGDIMVRYCRTLDSGTNETVLLNLWSILEHLTGTVGQRYDTLIKRAANLFDENELLRATLEVLRSRRNRIVHAGAHEEPSRDEVVLLHRIVSHGILLAIQKSQKYKELGDVGDFLALPKSKESLSRGISMRKEALKYHRL